PPSTRTTPLPYTTLFRSGTFAGRPAHRTAAARGTSLRCAAGGARRRRGAVGRRPPRVSARRPRGGAAEAPRACGPSLRFRDLARSVEGVPQAGGRGHQGAPGLVRRAVPVVAAAEGVAGRACAGPGARSRARPALGGD